MNDPSSRPDPLARHATAPSLPRTLEWGLRQADPAVLGDFLGRHASRLRRIVAIRLEARLARLLEEEGLPPEVLALAPAREDAGKPLTEGEALERLAELLERAVTFDLAPTVANPEVRRTLGLEGTAGPAEPAGSSRAQKERLVDAEVAALEPAALREVVLLRDYCGAEWELVRERLGLLSVDVARELYARAHRRLARRLRGRPGNQHR